jgi:hypothetical protein
MDFKVVNYEIPNGFFSSVNGFLSLFGDITKASKGDTLVSDGLTWVKSQKKNVFINYKGVPDDIICKIVPNSTEHYEYILHLKGFVKNDDDGSYLKVDLSYIVDPNGKYTNGFISGATAFDFIINDNILTITLKEPCIYGLEIASRPFSGKLSNLQIQFDTSDKTKYYTFIP